MVLVSQKKQNDTQQEQAFIPQQDEGSSSDGIMDILSSQRETDYNYNMNHLSELTLINFIKLNEQVKKGQAPVNNEIYNEIKKYLNSMEMDISKNKKESKNTNQVSKKK